MRQAGRSLPEYRKLKLNHSFSEMVRIPELAAEVTLQPVRRFDFDAAIIFSDILVVAEALGQNFNYSEEHGVLMDWKLDHPNQIIQLSADSAVEKLSYVGLAISLVRKEVGAHKAIIGFAGSPWTLANFMLEGGGGRDFNKALKLYKHQPKSFEKLLEKLSEVTISYLKLQLSAGADVIQIFDSLAYLVPADEYISVSGKWIQFIIKELNPEVPKIVFVRGEHKPEIVSVLGAQVIGLDSSVRLRDYADRLPPNMAVQGNLDPLLLLSTPKEVACESRRLLQSMRGRSGHVFNLGHGVPPNAKLECIEALVQAVIENKLNMDAGGSS